MQKRILLLALLLIIPAFSLDTEAQPGPLGPASESSCARASATSGGNLGTRNWIIRTGTNTGLCSGSSGAQDFGAGTSLTLHCTEVLQGTVQPAEANSLRIDLVIDNVGFGSAAPPAFRSITPAGNLCAASPTQTDTTIACTNDGTATGSPRYGIVRLHLEAINTAPGTGYDVHSEDNQASSLWGIFRCLPSLSAMSQSNPQTTYVPADTIGVSYMTDSIPYDTTVSGNAWVTCGSSSFNLGNDFPTTTSRSLTTTIKGSLTLWQDDCTNIQFGFVFTRNSAVSGFTSVGWATWTGTPPTSVTFTGTNASLATTAILDRTLTPSASCSGVLTPLNRGEVESISCAWSNARGVQVPNNQLATGFFLRPSGLFDTTDFPSTDFQFAASGVGTYSSTARTTAMDTNATLPLDYAAQVETFAASRSTSELLGVGNKTAQLDVSSLLNASNITNSKSSVIVLNESKFTIGKDNHFMRVTALQGARGNLLSGVSGVQCQRIEPDGTTESFVTMGPTDSNGNTPFASFAPVPPIGNWTAHCTLSFNGNTLDYSGFFLYISPISSDTTILIFARLYNMSGSLFLNVTARGTAWDSNNDKLSIAYPDDTDIRLYAIGQLSAPGKPENGILVNLTNHILMRPLNVTNDTFFANVSITNATGMSSGNVVVKMNLSGKTFVVTQPILDPSIALTGGTMGNFLGNFTGNFTIVKNGTVDGMISTALDQWLPFLIWGGLLLGMGYLSFWGAIAASLICLIDSIQPNPVMNFAGRILFFVLIFMINLFADKGWHAFKARTRLGKDAEKEQE